MVVCNAENLYYTMLFRRVKCAIVGVTFVNTHGEGQQGRCLAL